MAHGPQREDRNPGGIMTRVFPSPPASLEMQLVAMLFDSEGPMIGLGAGLAIIAVLLCAWTGDIVIAALGLLIVIITVGRVAVVRAFRRASPGSIKESRLWEFRYAVGSYAISAAIGALNLRTASWREPVLDLLAVTVAFGYGTGLVTRLAVRPKICWISGLLTMVPTTCGFLLFVDRTDRIGSLPTTIVLLFMIVAFLFGGFEMIRYSYGAMLSQLAARRDLARIVRRDALTGLANRIMLREQFERDLTRLGDSDQGLALHYLDLNDFKAVNDTFGHPVGDELLRRVAERLQACLRPGDTAARLGGDEFVVIQAGIGSKDEAELLARRMVAALSQPYRVGEEDLRVGTTIGIALAPRDGVDLDRLAAFADAALYHAKRNRRGSFSFWDAALKPRDPAIAA